ncbi:paralyzed flagella protein 20 [Novymonas esmeraldas]|uniref:Paralyzed flagella protein 20 n=1 Tax=Novymonas esmeraldas TaxID=1808958 RepID=A0AAW0F074_9TRYP
MSRATPADFITAAAGHPLSHAGSGVAAMGGYAAADMDLDSLRRSVQAQQQLDIPPPPTAQLLRVPEVMDDFVRNFLHRHGMTHTLQTFENEWYRKGAGGGGGGAGSPNVSPANPMVPDNYRETMALQNRVEMLERELRQHAELTTRVTQQWTQAKKDREYHRTNHQRVVQENARLSRLLKQAGQHAELVNPTLTESRIRCEQLLKAKALLTIERDKLRHEKEQLEARVAELEGQQQQQQQQQQTAAGAVAAGPKPPPAAASRGGTQKTTRAGGKAAAASRRGASPSPSPAGAKAGADTAADVFVWPPDDRPHPPGALVAVAAPFPGDTGDGPAGFATSASPATEWVEQSSFQAHTMAVTSVALHPFKPVVASGSDDGCWRLSALPAGDAIVSGQGHSNWVSCVGIHPRGTMLATGSGDKTVKLWDFASSRCAATLDAHTDGVWDLEFQDTGVLLASAALDKTARVWDVERGVCRQTLRGHQDAVNTVSWLPCTNLLLTGSADKCVAVWDARQGTKAQTFTGHRAAVLSVAAGPVGGSLFASCDTEGGVVLWDARRMVQLLRVECGPQPSNCVAVDAAGHYVAVASDDGTIKVIDVEEAVVTELVGHEGPVQSVAFDLASHHFLVSGGSDRTIRYWC